MFGSRLQVIQAVTISMQHTTTGLHTTVVCSALQPGCEQDSTCVAEAGVQRTALEALAARADRLIGRHWVTFWLMSVGQ